MNAKMFKSFLFEAQNSFFRVLLRLRFPIERNSKVTFLGNDYSGYWFPDCLINRKGTIWGVGLGKDSSFELILTQKGYKFYGFEPEKSCFKDSLRQFADTDAVLYEYGLWDKTGKFKYAGENISIVNIFNLDKLSVEEIEIKSLWEVAKDLNLDSLAIPRILKMNIEGAEREILLKLTKYPLNFDVIIFQAEFLFHIGFIHFQKKIKAFFELNLILSKLLSTNWELVYFSRHQIILSRIELK
jgi:FkbM family methyltransferase